MRSGGIRPHDGKIDVGICDVVDEVRQNVQRHVEDNLDHLGVSKAGALDRRDVRLAYFPAAGEPVSIAAPLATLPAPQERAISADEGRASIPVPILV